MTFVNISTCSIDDMGNRCKSWSETSRKWWKQVEENPTSSPGNLQALPTWAKLLGWFPHFLWHLRSQVNPPMEGVRPLSRFFGDGICVLSIWFRPFRILNDLELWFIWWNLDSDGSPTPWSRSMIPWPTYADNCWFLSLSQWWCHPASQKVEPNCAKLWSYLVIW